MFIVIVTCLACCGCASDPHGLRTSHINVIENTYMDTLNGNTFTDGDCAGEISLATCDQQIHKGVNNQRFVMVR